VASESYLCRLAADTGSHHVPKMVLHADVKGNKTVEELRNGVSSTPIGTVFHNQGKVAPGPDEDQHDLYLHAANVELRDLFLSDGLVEFSSFQTTGRCLTRMVFEDFGWPIKFFRNLGELMRTLYGALEGALHCDAVVAFPPSDTLLKDIRYCKTKVLPTVTSVAVIL